jgi:hypothetical protein
MQLKKKIAIVFLAPTLTPIYVAPQERHTNYGTSAPNKLNEPHSLQVLREAHAKTGFEVFIQNLFAKDLDDFANS